MVVVGITGRRRRAAAAVAVDGELVAAVSEAMISRIPAAGYRESGFPDKSVDAALRRAGVTAKDVTGVISADGRPHSQTTSARLARAALAAGFEHATVRTISTLAAYLRQARLAVDSGLVLAVDCRQCAAAAARVDERGVSGVRPAPVVARLLQLTARLSRAFAITSDDAGDVLQTLELIARPLSSDQVPWFADIDLREADHAGIDAAFEAQVAKAVQQAGTTLGDASTPHVEAQRVRAGVAEGFLRLLATAMAKALTADETPASVETIAVVGSCFTSPDFNARLNELLPAELRVAPASTAEGAAVGAALDSIDRPLRVAHLGLGPAFTESDAKTALENCRLDYVYEPVWLRLCERVSRVLSRGKVVAWFQDSAEFGPPILGSRSVLADPSHRYARDNINRFLRQIGDDWPIPVSIAAAGADCLASGALSPWQFQRAMVQAPCRDRLRAVIDSQGRVHAHIPDQVADLPFANLLDVHWQRSQVPGLINVALQGVGEPVACSPRDAIRATFSSAIDAIVIQRFLVMKDYWQLRTGEV